MCKSANTLEVLMVEPGKHPSVETIGSDLHSLQDAVGGYIEAAYFFDDPVALVCWEEAKLQAAPLNRAIYDANGELTDIIAGKFFICGLGDEDFVSLPKDLQEKYEARFHQPEGFLKLGRGIAVIPIEPVKEAKAMAKAPSREER